GFCGGSKKPRISTAFLHSRRTGAEKKRQKAHSARGQRQGGRWQRQGNFLYPAFSSYHSHIFLGRGEKSMSHLRSMSARQRHVHPRPRAAIGTTASTAQISGTVGSSGPKVHRCARKHSKRRSARHHQRERPSARMLLKWLVQNLCPRNPHKRYPS